MTRRLANARALALTAVFAMGALAVFLLVSDRVGGPSLPSGPAYRVAITVPDAHGLVERSDVLVRGVAVGSVETIEVVPEGTRLGLAVAEPAAPLRTDATVRAGSKTLLEEAYVDLDPGRQGRPLSSGSRLPANAFRPTVELEEALEPLAAAGDEQRSMLASLERGVRSDEAAERLNLSVRELRRLVGEARTLTGALAGQEGTLASGVANMRVILAELATREDSIRRVVAGGESTLSTVASRRGSLEQTLRELPTLLATAETTFRSARPLLREARPLTADLRRAAPDLSPALSDLRPVARDASVVLAELPELERAGLPFLRRARTVVRAARPVARELSPAVANIVPVVRHLAPRRHGLSALLGHSADLTGPRTGRDPANRTFVIDDRGTATGRPGEFRNNAYPRPGDARAPQPYEPGSYPRLRPLYRP